MPDVIEETARQVRIADDGWGNASPIHRLHKAERCQSGALYKTICGQALAAFEGAMLTTRDTTCNACLSGGRKPPTQRTKEVPCSGT